MEAWGGSVAMTACPGKCLLHPWCRSWLIKAKKASHVTLTSHDSPVESYTDIVIFSFTYRVHSLSLVVHL